MKGREENQKSMAFCGPANHVIPALLSLLPKRQLLAGQQLKQNPPGSQMIVL